MKLIFTIILVICSSAIYSTYADEIKQNDESSDDIVEIPTDNQDDDSIISADNNNPSSSSSRKVKRDYFTDHYKNPYQPIYNEQQSYAKNYNTYNNPEANAPILRQIDDRQPDGSYHYEYETGNGISARQTSHQNGLDKIVSGSYSYTGPDGIVYTTNYVADQFGYRAYGDHLPAQPHNSEITLRDAQLFGNEFVYGKRFNNGINQQRPIIGPVHFGGRPFVQQPQQQHQQPSFATSTLRPFQNDAPINTYYPSTTIAPPSFSSTLLPPIPIQSQFSPIPPFGQSTTERPYSPFSPSTTVQPLFGPTSPPQSFGSSTINPYASSSSLAPPFGSSTFNPYTPSSSLAPPFGSSTINPYSSSFASAQQFGSSTSNHNHFISSTTERPFSQQTPSSLSTLPAYTPAHLRFINNDNNNNYNNYPTSTIQPSTTFLPPFINDNNNDINNNNNNFLLSSTTIRPPTSNIFPSSDDTVYITPPTFIQQQQQQQQPQHTQFNLRRPILINQQQQHQQQSSFNNNQETLRSFITNPQTQNIIHRNILPPFFDTHENTDVYQEQQQQQTARGFLDDTTYQNRFNGINGVERRRTSYYNDNNNNGFRTATNVRPLISNNVYDGSSNGNRYNK